jgi:hypothetical protein
MAAIPVEELYFEALLENYIRFLKTVSWATRLGAQRVYVCIK